MDHPFNTKDELQAVLNTLWERIFSTPTILCDLTSTNLAVQFRFTDFHTSMTIQAGKDGHQILWDAEVTPDVLMILSSETSHRFWMEKLNIPLALASRKIVAKGSVQKALKLLPALKPAFALYPEVLKDMGYGHLLARPAPTGKRRKRPLFSFRKPSPPPEPPRHPFPMDHEETKRKLTAPPAHTEPPGLVDLYVTMCTIRAFEDHLSEAYHQGSIPTEAIHLSVGQEAVAAGVCLNLRPTDLINTTHRGHGHIIAKGADLNRMMAELYGKQQGLCEGKGGSMHVTDTCVGVMGANGIVGAGYLLAMGAAHALKYQGKDDISVVFAGDGSVNQGMFHEALNMIQVFDLPVLIVIENNLYGEFTHVERHSADPEIHRRIAAYHIESFCLDGNDAEHIFTAVGEIIGQMRRDGRPRAVELKTYRWHGHMEGDPEHYRTSQEKLTHMQDDPVRRLRKSLLEQGLATERKLSTLSRDIEARIDKAVQFAKQSPAPEPKELLTRVYAPDDPSLHEGAIPMESAGTDFSCSQAINQAIAEEMNRDEHVFLWGEDVSLGGYFNVTDGLFDTMGRDRIIDTPISENAIVGGAVGAAMAGLRPVCEILFADFLTCCMDPIVNQAAKLRYMTGGQASLPLTIRTPVGSGIGMAAQHSQSMERYFHGTPGLIVVAPSDAYTAKGLLKSAIRSNNPVLFFEHKLLYAATAPLPGPEYTLPLGKARIVRKGKDATLVSHLLGISVCRDAARILEARGFDVEIIDLCTLYPMDTGTLLGSVAATGRLITVEEGPMTGGIGAEVISRVCTAGFHHLKARPVRIAAPECPIPYAKNLEHSMIPDPSRVADVAEALILG
ncbi:thiamine pyrophosphate-dependent enzyme [Desulfoluna spongiiphila]|uniref:thiamine pyrophosphate-dependent enzyme n=1 Tax=Desulfoluna spongiiphila TaxID=419481 RepID=UPI0012545591|nr:thiamine pyrophosphate-dependent enzyme [Desulfoluna spongiiphila]VVS94797.1 dehydrogenase e1 component [Desulfoluna spongiiphila]